MILKSLQSFLLLAMVTSTGVCQGNLVEKKNLQADWLVFENGNYFSYNNDKADERTVYFRLNSSDFKGDYMTISDVDDFSIMVNGKLIIDQQKSVTLSIDSLSRKFSSIMLVAIHQEEPVNSNLVTVIRSNGSASKNKDTNIAYKKSTAFRDFIITAILILFIFFISVIRLNPRLSSNYFSVNRIFSLREIDDDQIYYRLTSGNILFYAFTSLLLAFYLILIDQFIDTGLNYGEAQNYLTNLLTWLKVSFVIFILLFTKMIVIYMITSLFGVSDIAGIHFFNFISLLLVLVGTLTISLMVYYLMHGQQSGFYNFLYQFLIWILGGWIILLFLKLTNRVQHSAFHLFSYICATEIIPFLLIVKVLNE